METTKYLSFPSANALGAKYVFQKICFCTKIKEAYDSLLPVLFTSFIGVIGQECNKTHSASKWYEIHGAHRQQSWKKNYAVTTRNNNIFCLGVRFWSEDPYPGVDESSILSKSRITKVVEKPLEQTEAGLETYKKKKVPSIPWQIKKSIGT